jgi:hypothetical protein
VKGRVAALIAAALLVALVADAARILIERRPSGGFEVPLMLQTDYPEAVCTIGGQKRSVSTSGCGVVCIAMAAAVLTDSAETPHTLFQWAYDNGLYFGDGLGHEAMSQLAARCGLRGQWLENRAEPVLEALSAGRPVVAHMGRGTFTQNGHYILLYGIDPDGLIRVNDPYSAQRSETAYPVEEILKEVKTVDAFMALDRGYDRAVRVF